MIKQNTGRETIYLQSAKMCGIKGIGKTLNLDFAPSKSREFMDNAEFWGLDRSKYDFGALKSIMLIGENGTGKSSVLESMLMLDVFMKDPRRLMEHKRINTLNYYEEKGHIKWEMEYVTRSDGRIFKYFIEVELQGNIIKTEKLSYISTKDGKTISDKECIYNVKNNSLVEIFGKSIPEPIRLLGANGWTFVQRRGSTLSLLFGEPKKMEDQFILHRHFFTNAFSSSINRHHGFNNDITPVVLNDIGDIKVQGIARVWYKLFDKNIQDVEISNGQINICYLLGSIKKTLTVEQYMATASTGNVRSLDLIHSILSAITSQRTIYIDEPERSIHEMLANFVVEEINAFAKGQVFYATHFLALTDQAIRTDQIILLYRGGNDEIKAKSGYEISPSKNLRFLSSYMKSENISEPNSNAREELDDLMDDYAKG